METPLDICLDNIMREEDVTGCLLADKHGLCLAAIGIANPGSTGVISAIVQQAAKLEPSSPTPVILLESDNRKCLIHQSPSLTTAIFKSSASS